MCGDSVSPVNPDVSDSTSRVPSPTRSADSDLTIPIEEIGAQVVRRSGRTTIDGFGAVLDAVTIDYSVALSRSAAEVRLRGDVETTAPSSCTRCLKRVTLPLRQRFDLLYLPVEQSPAPGEGELDGTQLDVDYYSSSSFDLRAALTEQVLLAVPMQLLCKDDCKGLCAHCGGDRNERSCDCAAPGDPRLAGLAALRDQL